MIILVNNVCTAVFHPTSVIFVYSHYVFFRHVVRQFRLALLTWGSFRDFLQLSFAKTGKPPRH